MNTATDQAYDHGRATSEQATKTKEPKSPLTTMSAFTGSSYTSSTPTSHAPTMSPNNPLPSTSSTSKNILLFNITSGKLSYVSSEDLRLLRMRKIVQSNSISLLALSVDIHTGLERQTRWGTLELPSRALLGRWMGWWKVLWVVEGVEDV